MDIADRILKLREDQTREQFTEGTDTSAQTLYKYEKRTGKPTIEFVDQICKKFNIKHEWLIAGTGPMRPGEPRQPTTEQPQQPVNALETDSCARCAKMETELELERQERREMNAENRELSAENRQLNAEIRKTTRENGELRAEVAVLQERLKVLSGKSVAVDVA